ncbi:CsbD family protein [Nannocystis pusilla]|uniref:CsbD family protein n=1 Tax=Nannocystis pusilla TaxID=889268 RepID=A0A9X3EN67_9BACT|nr:MULTISPECIES: CsbD family protein [Nannocystis]MCY0990479.1 CsbD family protein [Nannocystis sp. ILAH1]MCY1007087.1 CsbD family protein [Nannocystis pusilla]MCY1069233.1 CsbD family protein [Nannocystis sp. RBIL2]
MNRDQIQGKWEQLKGKAKQFWGNLTDDDFLKAEGNADKLCGIIQERSGERREEIERKLGYKAENNSNL